MAWTLAYQSSTGTGTVMLAQSGVNVEEFVGNVSAVYITTPTQTDEWISVEITLDEKRTAVFVLSPTSALVIRDMARPG